jgi:hypothetical protein
MSQSDTPDPPSELSQSQSGSPPDSHRLEWLIQEFIRGIQACTDSSLSVKVLVEGYLGNAVEIIREDIVLAGSNQFRRIDDLTRAVQGITLGNQQALGAMQELIDAFRAEAGLERGLALQTQDGLKATTKRLEQTTREISEQNIRLPPRVEIEPAPEPGETRMPAWIRVEWNNFGELGWKHKGRIVGILSITVMAWLKAAPSIVDAIKLFLGGG